MVWVTYWESQVARNDTPFKVDELKVALFSQRSRGVHPAWASPRGGKESVREHACALWSQPKSLYPSRHTGQEANYQAVDDQQASGIYLHSSRSTEEKNTLWTVPSLLLSLWAPHDCRKTRFQLVGLTPCHKRQYSERPPRKPQCGPYKGLSGESTWESHSRETAENELPNKH